MNFSVPFRIAALFGSVVKFTDCPAMSALLLDLDFADRSALAFNVEVRSVWAFLLIVSEDLLDFPPLCVEVVCFPDPPLVKFLLAFALFVLVRLVRCGVVCCFPEPPLFKVLLKVLLAFLLFVLVLFMYAILCSPYYKVVATTLVIVTKG